MPKYEKYPNEDPKAAKSRIARNRAQDRNQEGESSFDKIKTKADMMASNIAGTIKNMGGVY